MVGGTDLSAENLISGNGGDGVHIAGPNNLNSLVANNFIGTDVNGLLPIPNKRNGVFIGGAAGGNTIGGTGETGNLISANGMAGILITDQGTNGNLIAGNEIGLNEGGPTQLGNASGINIFDGASFNTIGGTGSDSSNVITENNGNGITVGRNSADTAAGNAIEGNSIFDNGKLDLDLGNDGVTPNLPQAHTGGPNLLQQYPILSSAIGGGESTTIDGTLSAQPNTTYRIEFFSVAESNPSGHGGSEGILNFVNITTDSTGASSFSYAAPGGIGGYFVTATATDPLGDTSEFSANVAVAPNTSVALTSAANPSTVGQTLTVTATVTDIQDTTAVPSGSIQFFVDGTAYSDPVDLDANASASIDMPDLSLGTHSVTAEYSPDDDTFAYNTSQALSQVVNLPAGLKVISLGPVTPSPRNQPVASISVTFNEPIELGSSNMSALELTRDGGSNLITSGGMTITAVSGSTYQIGGLAGLTADEGTYSLTVDAADLEDSGGQSGTGSLSTSWLTDLTDSHQRDQIPASTDNVDPIHDLGIGRGSHRPAWRECIGHSLLYHLRVGQWRPVHGVHDAPARPDVGHL